MLKDVSMKSLNHFGQDIRKKNFENGFVSTFLKQKVSAIYFLNGIFHLKIAVLFKKKAITGLNNLKMK